MCQNDGWDIELVLKKILAERTLFPYKLDRKFAKILLNCIVYSEDKAAFRIHSKG